MVFANEAAAQQVGYASADELLNAPVAEIMGRFEVFDEERRPLPLDQLPGRAALRGETLERTICYRVVETREERWSLVRARPILAADGHVQFAINVFHDVTERKRAEERLAFLAGASNLLSSSLDYETTLGRIPKLAVPSLADWCVVDMLEPDGTLRRVGATHVDPAMVETLLEIAQPRGYRRIIAEGEPLLLGDIDEERLREAARDEAHLEQLRQVGSAALICIPLVARGRSLGAITLASTTESRPYGAEELALAEELGKRAALAVDHAILYREAQEGARRLEESLALLDALLGSAPVGVGFWDRELRYVRVNEKLAELNGIPPEEHVGRSLADVVPQHAAALEPIYRRVLETGEPREHQESTQADPTQPGEDRHWLSSYYPVKTPSGETIGVGAVITEITERRRAEAERARLLEAEQATRRDAERSADMLRRLHAATQGALANVELKKLLDDLLERIAELLEADTAAVLLLEEERDELVATHARGIEEEVEQGVRIPLGRGFAGRIAAERRPLTIEDIDRADVYNPLLRQKGIKSLLGVPLRLGERVIGVLHVGSLTQRRFTSDDRTLLQLAGDRIALTLEQARLFDSERSARAAAEAAGRRLAFLAEASRILSASLDYETTLANVAELAATKFADWMSVYLVDEEGSATRIQNTHRDPAKRALVEELAERYPPQIEPGSPQAQVLAEGRSFLFEEIPRPMLEEAAQDDEHLRLIDALGLSSAVVVPVTAGGRTIGSLSFALAEGGRRYDDDDLALAEELGRRVGLAVENARLYGAAEARAESAQALEFVADGVFLVDAAGIVRLWNPAAQAITGLAAADVVGRRPDEAIGGWSDVSTRVPVARAPRDGGSPRPETVPVEVEGRELWLSVTAVEFEAGTVYAFRDVTEERGVEKLKSDFVSTVSHELRTPLAAIYGAALTLRRDDLPLEFGLRENLLGVIADEAERLARIVNDILWTSRIESQGLHLTIETCDAVAIAEGVLDAARVHAPDTITLALDAVPEARVAADADKVRQVLGNLVENAVKYSPGGGQVTVRVGTNGRLVRFRVEDEGLGIPASDHERVFEKFYRLDPDLTRGIGGTGLGLYICREFVRRMDGRIWVDSTPGRGSTFFVELPAP